jgi:carbonic anhydrase/acetyltransferase-like protein (isoleucine patch superfamily)
MPIYEFNGMRPKLPESGRFWIAPSADVIGNIFIEEEVSIWFNAVLRGDNEPMKIGRRSNIQDGCISHSDPGFPLTIGERCTIGHQAILHGCTIGNGALIGMGATVLNGAKIGEGSIVGAGSVVPEKKEYPANSLIIGTPARVLRPLDEKGVAMAAYGAEIYFKRWQEYAKSLKPVS